VLPNLSSLPCLSALPLYLNLDHLFCFHHECLVGSSLEAEAGSEVRLKKTCLGLSHTQTHTVPRTAWSGKHCVPDGLVWGDSSPGFVGREKMTKTMCWAYFDISFLCKVSVKKGLMLLPEKSVLMI